MLTLPIDVWNLSTFDEELLALLREHGPVLRNYELTSRKNYMDQQAADRWVPLKENPFSSNRAHVLEKIIMPVMEQRTIRAWHYTRLTDTEAAFLKSNGIYMSDKDGIRRRLDAQVEEGTLDPEIANTIYRESPFHTQADSRSGKFWMVSHPFPPNDGGVELLLHHWGGEGVYFWLKDPAHIELVQNIGRPRILEVAVPLSLTTSAYSAAHAVVATYIASLGSKPDWPVFDLYATSVLGPDAVLGMHSEGDPAFAAMARDYPPGFVNWD